MSAARTSATPVVSRLPGCRRWVSGSGHSRHSEWPRPMIDTEGGQAAGHSRPCAPILRASDKAGKYSCEVHAGRRCHATACPRASGSGRALMSRILSPPDILRACVIATALTLFMTSTWAVCSACMHGQPCGCFAFPANKKPTYGHRLAVTGTTTELGALPGQGRRLLHARQVHGVEHARASEEP